ncbi:hypothetical protein PSY31_22950, partial [Shigella flexneri]|nr:hypothetical protein [Shigella flexneri]
SCMTIQQQPQTMWYVDNGCSSHIIGNKSIFIDVDQSVNSKMKLGDGQLHPTEGKGSFVVQTKGGNKKTISDVLYVLNLTSNLLSVGQLM